jgi:chromosome segregation ATPase
MTMEKRGEPARCVIARERLEAVRQDIREINQRLDKFATGMLEKMKGDTQLAARVQQNKDLVQALDTMVVRGEAGSSSIKAEVENLRREVDLLSTSLRETETALATIEREDAAVEAARISAKSADWKATAVLIGVALTAIASLLVAILK